MRFLERTLQYCWLDTQCLVLSPANIRWAISNSTPEKIKIKFMASLFGRAKINPENVARPAGFEPATPRFIPLQLSLPPWDVCGLDGYSTNSGKF